MNQEQAWRFVHTTKIFTEKMQSLSQIQFYFYYKVEMFTTSTQLFKEELAEVRKDGREDYWSGKKASCQKTARDFKSENRPAASQIPNIHLLVYQNISTASQVLK